MRRQIPEPKGCHPKRLPPGPSGPPALAPSSTATLASLLRFGVILFTVGTVQLTLCWSHPARLRRANCSHSRILWADSLGSLNLATVGSIYTLENQQMLIFFFFSRVGLPARPWLAPSMILSRENILPEQKRKPALTRQDKREAQTPRDQR